MAVNLTTRAKVKAILGISTSTDNNLIDMQINQVSRQVAQICDRTFEEATYREWYDGTGSPFLRLRQYPITRLYGVATNTVAVGTLKYTGSGAFASVDFNTSSISLVNTETNGSETVNTINTNGKTISELSTSVNAVSGWSWTTQSGKGNYMAEWCKPIASGTCKDPQTIDIDHPDTFDEARRSAGTDDMIEAVHTVFPCGVNNVWVWYKAGYALPASSSTALTAGSVPQGLEMVVNQIVAESYRANKSNVAMKSESLGDYSYTLNDQTVTDTVTRHQKELWPWMRKRL